jgi:Predicted permeases
MSIAFTAFNQIIIMFLIILVGVFCYKINLIDQEMNKKLSNLLLLLINPLVIFISYQRKFEATLLKGLLISLVLAIITHFAGIIISIIAVRGKKYKADLAIERFAIVYSNCGFIGIPLVHGVFGSEGVFYLTAYMTVFNLFAWTHGVIIVSGKSDRKSVISAMLSPSVIATLLGFLFFVCRLILPEVINNSFSYLGNMNTPLAMLVAGVTIAQTDILHIFVKPRIYYLAILKLIILPVIMMFIFNFWGLPRIVLLTSILACACPVAATINLFSIRYEKNYLYASELFAVTTILSMVTIPIVMLLSNLMVK